MVFFSFSVKAKIVEYFNNYANYNIHDLQSINFILKFIILSKVINIIFMSATPFEILQLKDRERKIAIQTSIAERNLKNRTISY